MEKINQEIAQSVFSFQSAIYESGSSLEEFIKENYVDKWKSQTLYCTSRIRTTFVTEMTNFLVKEGLINLERVMMSLITDPLAHDIEHTPSISYKGQTYVTTHSMIYNKFLACFNDKIKGIFVDSPNIRLELESPLRIQRGRYLIDFSQMDIELRRNRNISYEEYLTEPEKVKAILDEDMDKALDFYERLIIHVTSKLVENNQEDLDYLGVQIKVPKQPFPIFTLDEIRKKHGKKSAEQEAGKSTDEQFFWVRGLLRENYDLVYPYLKKDGTKVKKEDITSDMIYNYDICAKSISKDGTHSPALEIMSGGIREWLYEPIIERLIDNKIIPARPIIKDGTIENIDEISGYGPFLLSAYMKDNEGKQCFPDTFGGGIGIERSLLAILRGDKIKKVDDLTFFGKNPDGHHLYLF